MNRQIYEVLIKNDVINSVWIPEMELLYNKEIEYRMRLFADTLYLDGLYVFAINGGGDMFAWDANDNVFFIDVATGECLLFSYDLPSAIFRRIIEFARGDFNEFCSDDTKAMLDDHSKDDFVSLSEAKALFEKYINCLGFSFKKNWIAKLEGFITFGFSDTLCNGFISTDDSILIMEEIIPFNKTSNIKK